MRRANTCRMIVALATFAAATSVASGRDLLSDDFNDGDLNGWTASGAGTWSVDNVAYPKTAHHVATGTAGWIEHPLDLSGDTWSVEYEAGWQWEPAAVLRIWVDANRPVIRVEATGEMPFEVQVALELWRNEPRELKGTEINSAYGLAGDVVHMNPQV